MLHASEPLPRRPGPPPTARFTQAGLLPVVTRSPHEPARCYCVTVWTVAWLSCRSGSNVLLVALAVSEMVTPLGATTSTTICTLAEAPAPSEPREHLTVPVEPTAGV